MKEQGNLLVKMTWFNLSGTLTAFRLFKDPALCLPHHTISTFNSLPIPLSKAFTPAGSKEKEVEIKAVVLDKDNCFAIPHTNTIYPGYRTKFQQLREAYPGSKLLIVSNTAGTSSDSGFKEAELLEKNTGVTVLRHATKKPGCHGEIMEYFKKSDAGVTSPSQVVIVGDRLLTDVLMANMMGARSVWVRDGVKEGGEVPNWVYSHIYRVNDTELTRKQIARTEGHFADFLTRRGYVPQQPESPFE
jgi:phosphatidylglycerophosphatase GEP4